MKVTNAFAVVFIATLLLIVAVYSFDLDYAGGLRWAFFPKTWVKSELLKITPLGTSIDRCVAIIHSRIDYDSTRPISFENSGALPAGFDAKVIGKKSVVIQLSHYRYKTSLVFQDVYASYAFDEEGKLVDIVIERTFTGP